MKAIVFSEAHYRLLKIIKLSILLYFPSSCLCKASSYRKCGYGRTTRCSLLLLFSCTRSYEDTYRLHFHQHAIQRLTSGIACARRRLVALINCQMVGELCYFLLSFTYASVGRTTILVAGETYNVTWSMSYLHSGGFKLYLLNPEGQPLRQLTGHAVGTAFVAGNSPACVL